MENGKAQVMPCPICAGTGRIPHASYGLVPCSYCPPARRSSPLVVRLTPDQRAALDACAKEYGLAVSTWAREVLLLVAGREDLGDVGRLGELKRKVEE